MTILRQLSQACHGKNHLRGDAFFSYIGLSGMLAMGSVAATYCKQESSSPMNRYAIREEPCHLFTNGS